MAIDLHNFWANNSNQHPPLTDEALAEAESILGVQLPQEYIDLLRIQNGGYTLGFAFPTTIPTSWHPQYVSLEDLAGIVLDPNIRSSMNVLMTGYMIEEWQLPQNIVLLTGDGHWWIALDYRQGSTPSVVWIDQESDEDIQLAPTFADFLAGLVPESTFAD
ncbi:MAG TPA: SMI1/KNR4 family protein [Fimbriimonadaceae bacterium]|nr:SMI1/KNR4 family protein [Fimbriimonadaceae bacterium]HRJ33101.1 SMI1/KNR4 family protein [Fimbriimonadaceae bacterium]